MVARNAIYDGAGSRIRTDDLLITNQLLYQLSYAGVDARKLPYLRRGNKDWSTGLRALACSRVSR